jgi:hypothetical protein
VEVSEGGGHVDGEVVPLQAVLLSSTHGSGSRSHASLSGRLRSRKSWTNRFKLVSDYPFFAAFFRLQNKSGSENMVD